MDGVETVRHIRQHEHIVPPHIIMISAYDRQDCLRQVQGLNVSDVLVKPLQLDVLKEALKTAFRGDLSQQAKEVRADIQGAKVLLAEDNKINQMVATELLKVEGFETTVAENGRVAIELLQKEEFDLVLMDVQMPEMDGFEATKAIRSDARFKNLPILAMTANAMSGDRELSLEAGMNDHIAKPIEPKVLYNALIKWIRK